MFSSMIILYIVFAISHKILSTNQPLTGNRVQTMLTHKEISTLLTIVELNLVLHENYIRSLDPLVEGCIRQRCERGYIKGLILLNDHGFAILALSVFLILLILRIRIILSQTQKLRKIWSLLK